MEPTVCFVSATHQNVFFGELLDALGEALTARGVAVEHSLDCFPPPREGLVYIFIPHELLPVLMAEAHPSELQLRRSVTICTEQPGTSWFDEDVRISQRAAAVIDINRLGVAALKKLGIHARLLQLGYVPGWDRWHGGEHESERPVQFAFLGGATPRRLTALARCGRYIAGRPTELHLFETTLPHTAHSKHFLSGPRKWDLLSRSRVLMNVHRGELGYFEWQRAIEAIVNGCVLLSEHSLGFEPLIPGEHFVSASFDSLEVALEALLEDEQRLARMRASAYAFLREQHPLSSSIDVLLEAVGEVASRPVPTAAAGVGGAPALPKPPEAPPTEYELMLRGQLDLNATQIAIGRLNREQRDTRRALHDLRRAVNGKQDGDENLSELFGPRGGSPARVSVLITAPRELSSVGAAINSVAASEFIDYELIILEEARGESSGAAVRTALNHAPWVTATLITSSDSHSLAHARNLGVHAASGELLLVLDAQHEIYPHAMGRLVRAIDETPTAAFAYGINEQRGIDGPSCLTGYLGWDPGRLRHGNFIDTVMMRKSALLQAGGYIVDPRLEGWEDFALWCAFADRGWEGIRVAEILAHQQLTLDRMISLTPTNTAAAWGLLLERFAFLSA
jgi:hypothetical protein